MQNVNQSFNYFNHIAQEYHEALYKNIAKNPLMQMVPVFNKLFFDILNKTLPQILSDPIKIYNKTLSYQLKIIQAGTQVSNANELVKTLHKELLNYYLELVEDTQIEEKDLGYFTFWIKQFFNACDPTNFILFNDKSLNKCIESKLENIFKGMANFQDEWLHSNKGYFMLPTVDPKPFKLGKNIAATEGKVIYKNFIIELICYKPKKEVHSIPVLIVPPCINKFYVLDLSESNSFVKWLVDNNFQVFILSWVNPKSSQQNFTFEEYVQQGILEPAKYILEEFGYKKLNTIGYCIGGTMLATLLGYCAKHKIDIFNSATFFNTLLDFSNLGDLSVFIRKETIEQFKKLGHKAGYFDGSLLYNFFNLLKSKEMIWSSYINHYLQGNEPKAFDILYWNADYVNMPLKMFEFYLEKMCLENLLSTPNQISILNTGIDLSKIGLPSFFVASKNDHIVPWQQSYKSMNCLGGDKTFCLTDSGHVAGILNPPHLNKYNHWLGKTQECNLTWLDAAKQFQGSWWNAYTDWLKKYSGEITKPIKHTDIPSIEKAPGDFCKS